MRANKRTHIEKIMDHLMEYNIETKLKTKENGFQELTVYLSINDPDNKVLIYTTPGNHVLIDFSNAGEIESYVEDKDQAFVLKILLSAARPYLITPQYN